jgi:hypothetical protein
VRLAVIEGLCPRQGQPVQQAEQQREPAAIDQRPGVILDVNVLGILFVGPMAKPASVLAQLSRLLTRWVTIAGSRNSGYLFAQRPGVYQIGDV